MSRPIPFLLDTSSEIPKFRAETFWTKEPETIHWINRNLSESTDIGLLIDVGANIGIYSLYAATVSKSISVFSVEPVPDTFRELNANIELNMKMNQISTFMVALSFESGSGTLKNVDPRLGSSGAQIQLVDMGDDASTKVLSGDRLLKDAWGKRDHDKKVMIKIDTDGNELDVLNGFIEAFKDGSIVTVLVETHPTNRNEIEAFFSRLDFREDESYLSIEGHSNYRREAKGNGERTKVYVCPTA
jgi:FkbM family methyltransferase